MSDRLRSYITSGDIIKAERVVAGKSQEFVGLRVGKSPKWVSNFETGKSFMTDRDLGWMGAVLKLSPRRLQVVREKAAMEQASRRAFNGSLPARFREFLGKLHPVLEEAVTEGLPENASLRQLLSRFAQSGGCDDGTEVLLASFVRQVQTSRQHRE